MSTMLGLPTFADYLHDVLAVSPVTTYLPKVYRGGMAPQGTALPYLLYFQQAGEDEYCLPGSAYAGTALTYFVKGVANTLQYQAVLKPGLAAVDAALQSHILTGDTLTGFVVTVLGSSQLREYEEVLPGGTVVVHCGRSWDFQVDAS